MGVQDRRWCGEVGRVEWCRVFISLKPAKSLFALHRDQIFLGTFFRPEYRILIPADQNPAQIHLEFHSKNVRSCHYGLQIVIAFLGQSNRTLGPLAVGRFSVLVWPFVPSDAWSSIESGVIAVEPELWMECVKIALTLTNGQATWCSAWKILAKSNGEDLKTI